MNRHLIVTMDNHDCSTLLLFNLQIWQLAETASKEGNDLIHGLSGWLPRLVNQIPRKH
jgi:hypothetical protein